MGSQDANGARQFWLKQGISDDDQQAIVQGLLANAPTLVEEVATWAAEQEGPARNEAIKRAFGLIVKLSDDDAALYEPNLRKRLGMTTAHYRNMVKSTKGLAAKSKRETSGEPVELANGFIQEHLLDMVFDPVKMETQLVVRFPDGRVEQTEQLTLDGVHYTARMPDTIMRKGAVLFPSRLERLRPTKELISIVRMFIHKYLDVDEFYEKLATYYVLFSWTYDSFTVLPYLRALGDYGTGKTRLIQTVGILAYRPTFTSGASTTSPIFRMLDKYRGTLVLDEADFTRSDEASDIIKLLNTGYMRGMPLLRSVDRGQAGFDVEAYEVFGPKIIATRKKFGDRALESRCLTKEMGGGVPRFDIPIVLPKEFFSQAMEIRNMLLAYRMKVWVADREIDYNAVDRAIEARLNQVTLAIKSLVEDADMVGDIDGFIREYNQQSVVERSLTMTAKVVEALALVGNEQKMGTGGQLFLKPIAERVNALIDDQNKRMGEEEIEDETNDRRGKKDSKVTSRKVGQIVRNYLQLRTERWTQGDYKGLYYVVWDEDRIQGLCSRYGVDFQGLKNGGNGQPPTSQAETVNILEPKQATLDSFAAERARWHGDHGNETEDGPDLWRDGEEPEHFAWEGDGNDEN